MKKLITSALPYVNNYPHLGNIIGCVLSADVYARFCRSRGYETLYVCGTDEYGTATENKAREEGLTPREICDKYFAVHDAVYKDFNISFDVFGRTSTEEQTEVAQSIFRDLDGNEFISEQTSERVFCEKDAIFLADRYVEGTCPHCAYEDARGDQCDQCQRLLDPESLGNPRCKICGTPPVLKATSHLYLELDKLQGRLADWFQSSSQKGQWTRNAIQTTSSWLEKGLQPRPITRDLKWGIPVPKPGYENKVFYVWYDAPIGYISITKKHTQSWRDWWQNPDQVQLYQFMAKDNIPFHTVIFPSALLGSGKPWTLLHHINSTEYLNYEGTKFSKSRSVGVFGPDVKATGLPIDLWRFYLLMARPERNDSDFNWNEFVERVNNDFIDNIGNLVNRTLVYLHKNFDGTIRDFTLNDDQQDFVDACKQDLNAIADTLEDVKLRDGLRLILALGNRANKFFQDAAPWTQIKTEPDLAHATVSVLTYLVRAMAVILEPYMPSTSARLLDILKLKDHSWSDALRFDGLDQHRIGQPEILYQKIDPKLAERFRKKFSGTAPNFGRFRIVVGQIQSVDFHPEAEHLYKLSIDCGTDGKRTIVAGLKKNYQPDQLVQRKVLVLANLEPADLRGITSQGMVLVCEKRNKMELLDGSPFPVGAVVAVDDQKIDHQPVAIGDFKGAPFKVANGVVLFDDQSCRIGDRVLQTEKLKNGKIR